MAVTTQPPASSSRASALADGLDAASLALTTLLERIDVDAWLAVPDPGVWSIGKEAEHVADGSVSHQWRVRLSIGQAKASQGPTIERRVLTSRASPADTIDLIRRTLAQAATLVRSLTDAQLDLPAKPPTGRPHSMAVAVEGMIQHVHHHRAEIESKLRRRTSRR